MDDLVNALAIAIAVVLFPGVIACLICDKITVHSPKWGSFKYSIYSFVFGVLSYVLLQALFSISHWVSVLLCFVKSSPPELLNVWTIVTKQTTSIDLSEVFFATLLAPVVASTASFIVNHKVINKIAQKLHISSKYGDENLFSFFLNAKEVDWVYVRDKSGELSYRGRIVSFSETDSMQEIVLSEVTVFEYETSEELYSVPLIYLSKPMGSFVIEGTPTFSMETANGKEADK